jgi:outer membrane protein TolC
VSQQRFNSDTTFNGAVQNAWQSGILATWTVFDGKRMFVVRDRLRAEEGLQNINLQTQVQETIAQVMQAYFDIAQQNQLYAVFETSVRLSEQRLKLAQDKYEVGRFSKTEVLRAEVDLNADKSQLIRQGALRQNAKTRLNQLLARSVSTDFVIEDSLALAPPFSLTDLQATAQSKNLRLKQLKAAQSLNTLAIKETDTERYPTLDLLLGYNYNRNKSEVGFAVASQTRGVRYGFTFNYPIFDGLNQRRRAANAQLTLKATDIQIEQERALIDQNLTIAFNNYSLSRQLLQLEQANIVVAERNFDLAQDQNRLGLITSIELREAQQNLILARSRLTTTTFDVKLAETELLRLSGQLVQ